MKDSYMEYIRYKRTPVPDIDNDARRVLGNEFLKSDRARDPELEILEASQVPVVGQHIKENDHQCLHANILLDLYGDDIIMCQPPSKDYNPVPDQPPKDLINLHWEMMWQRRVSRFTFIFFTLNAIFVI